MYNFHMDLQKSNKHSLRIGAPFNLLNDFDIFPLDHGRYGKLLPLTSSSSFYCCYFCSFRQISNDCGIGIYYYDDQLYLVYAWGSHNKNGQYLLLLLLVLLVYHGSVRHVVVEVSGSSYENLLTVPTSSYMRTSLSSHHAK